MFYIITNQTTTAKLFLFQNILTYCKSWPLPTLVKTKKKPFDIIYYLYKLKQSHWLLCIAKNCVSSWKITHCQTWLVRCSSWNQNLQRKQNWLAKSTNLKENAGKVKSVFVIRAALDVALKIAGVEKISSKNSWLQSTLRPFDLSFEWKER